MALLARLSRAWRRNLVHYHVVRAARSEHLTALFTTDHQRTFAAETSESEDEASTVHITDRCVERIKQLREGQEAEDISTMLRIRVDSGGCSGFQYSFNLDSAIEEGDRTFSKDGVQVVVDEVSMEFLKGATVDYTEELIKSSFEVTNNPNADSSCGCGNSFVLK